MTAVTRWFDSACSTWVKYVVTVSASFCYSVSIEWRKKEEEMKKERKKEEEKKERKKRRDVPPHISSSVILGRKPLQTSPQPEISSRRSACKSGDSREWERVREREERTQEKRRRVKPQHLHIYDAGRNIIIIKKETNIPKNRWQ